MMTCGTSAPFRDDARASIRSVTERHSLFTASCSRCPVCFLTIAYLSEERDNGVSEFREEDNCMRFRHRHLDRGIVCPSGCYGNIQTFSDTILVEASPFRDHLYFRFLRVYDLCIDSHMLAMPHLPLRLNTVEPMSPRIVP